MSQQPKAIKLRGWVRSWQSRGSKLHFLKVSTVEAATGRPQQLPSTQLQLQRAPLGPDVGGTKAAPPALSPEWPRTVQVVVSGVRKGMLKPTTAEAGAGGAAGGTSDDAGLAVRDDAILDLSGGALSVGASVEIVGTMVESKGAEQELEIQCDFAPTTTEASSQAPVLRVLGTADPTEFPIQPKRHSDEFLREKCAHLRVRTSVGMATMKVRSALTFAITDSLRHQGFMQIHTPVITASDCEGGGDSFELLDGRPDEPDAAAKVAANAGTGGKSSGIGGSSHHHTQRSFFRSPTGAHLSVSGQLHAEALACGMGKVFTFGPTFRAERDSHTPRHLAEFWMLEPELAFATSHDAMDVCERTVRHSLADILENSTQDLAALDAHHAAAAQDGGSPVPGSCIEACRSASGTEFVRMRYHDAQRAMVNSGFVFEQAPRIGDDLRREHERWLCEDYCGGVPVFITDWPLELKPFYMLSNQDADNTVANFDLLFPRVGELAGGSAREHDVARLQRRLPTGLEWYLDLRKYGTVPHAGFGIGFDRFVQFATGTSNIRDVIAFPRYSGALRY